jgi:hypothetical protein
MIRWLLILTIAAGALFAACGDDEDSSDSVDGAATDPASDGQAGVTATPSTETPIADVCEPNPAPATPETNVIESPEPLSKHQGSLGVTVEGQIASATGSFKIRIYDARGAVVSGASGVAAQPGVLSPFSQLVTALTVGEQPACIWVYEESPQDGSPVNVAQLPIVIQP